MLSREPVTKEEGKTGVVFQAQEAREETETHARKQQHHLFLGIFPP